MLISYFADGRYTVKYYRYPDRPHAENRQCLAYNIIINITENFIGTRVCFDFVS